MWYGMLYQVKSEQNRFTPESLQQVILLNVLCTLLWKLYSSIIYQYINMPN